MVLLLGLLVKSCASTKGHHLNPDDPKGTRSTGG
jgi:hypothetical protein